VTRFDTAYENAVIGVEGILIIRSNELQDLMKDCPGEFVIRGDWTLLELFIAGVPGWNKGLGGRVMELRHRNQVRAKTM
jgi:hypothetical protein